MDDAAAIGALDPELVLARLGASRWALVRTILVARIGIAAASLLLATRPGEGAGGSWWSVAVFAAYFVWTFATALRARPALDLVVRSPGWLWLEQALCVGLVVLGGGVRVISLYLCALPIIVATVFVGPRRGVALATGDAIVVAGVLGGTSLISGSSGTEPVHGTEWPPALVGLFIAVALFSYVRRLFIELERTGVAYRIRSHEITAAATAEARAEARTAALTDIARRLDGVEPDIRRRLNGLRRRRPADPPWQRECEQLERLADYARESLAELSATSTNEKPGGVAVTDVVAAAIGRVRSLGAGSIDLTVADCDLTVGDAAAEALGRFIEEALWNAHKHGRPPITVMTTTLDGRVTIAVGDNGQGFQRGSSSAWFGLASLTRDAELLGGQVRFTGEKDQPVTVILTFPASSNV